MAERRYKGFVPGAYAIDGYGAGGFVFAGMSHRGSILALPSGIHAWPVERAGDIDEDKLAPLFAEPPGAVQFLLIGTGKLMEPLPGAIRQRLRQAGISVDAMATGAAVSTYNIMLGEKRPVAAALLAAP
jgi:uncharacterized protein